MKTFSEYLFPNWLSEQMLREPTTKLTLRLYVQLSSCLAQKFQAAPKSELVTFHQQNEWKKWKKKSTQLKRNKGTAERNWNVKGVTCLGTGHENQSMLRFSISDTPTDLMGSPRIKTTTFDGQLFDRQYNIQLSAISVWAANCFAKSLLIKGQMLLQNR